jgi:hypothetical protein
MALDSTEQEEYDYGGGCLNGRMNWSVCGLYVCRAQWPRGLRGRSAAARLLRSWVRIPPVAWLFVCCDCCVLSCRGLCDELITRPEESYRLFCVVVCDLENLNNEEAMTRVGSQLHRKTKEKCLYLWIYVTMYVCIMHVYMYYVCMHVISAQGLHDCIIHYRFRQTPEHRCCVPTFSDIRFNPVYIS